MKVIYKIDWRIKYIQDLIRPKKAYFLYIIKYKINIIKIIFLGLSHYKWEGCRPGVWLPNLNGETVIKNLIHVK